MSRISSALRAERGFTLVELLVAMVILGVIVGAFGQLLVTTMSSSSRTQEQAVLQDLARTTIDRLARDLREATNANGTTPVETLSGTALTFDAPDNGTPYHLRRISYQLVGGTLSRRVTVSTDSDGWPWQWPATLGPWATTLDSITSGSIFTYFDAGGAPTTNPSIVRSVRITMTVAPRQAHGGRATYSALVSIRTVQ